MSDQVTIRMPWTLHDDIIDGLAQDVERWNGENISRSSKDWQVTRRGRGYIFTITVTPEAAAYISGYLRGRVGMHRWYCDGQAKAKRIEQLGVELADYIDTQLLG